MWSPQDSPSPLRPNWRNCPPAAWISRENESVLFYVGKKQVGRDNSVLFLNETNFFFYTSPLYLYLSTGNQMPKPVRPCGKRSREVEDVGRSGSHAGPRTLSDLSACPPESFMRLTSSLGYSGTRHEKALLQFASLHGLTPSLLQRPSWLCLNASPRLLRERTRRQDGEEEDLWVGGSSEKRGVIFQDPLPCEHLISSFIPFAEKRKLRPRLLCRGRRSTPRLSS